MGTSIKLSLSCTFCLPLSSTSLKIDGSEKVYVTGRDRQSVKTWNSWHSKVKIKVKINYKQRRCNLTYFKHQFYANGITYFLDLQDLRASSAEDHITYYRGLFRSCRDFYRCSPQTDYTTDITDFGTC